VLAAAGQLLPAAITVYGAKARAADLSIVPDPIERALLQAGEETLAAAVAEGTFSVQERDHLQEAAQALTVNELADVTLAALAGFSA
jgi:hypothetical protein